MKKAEHEQIQEISMWPSQIENDPQSQLPGGHNDPWKFFWRENPVTQKGVDMNFDRTLFDYYLK